MPKQKENSSSEILVAYAMKLLSERYADDYAGYSPSCLKRRIIEFLSAKGITTTVDLARHAQEEDFTMHLLQSITVNYTEMFRDPWFFRSVCTTALPYLSTYPLINIWHAGCSTGEEVYSLAILLYELDLLHRTKIYATDICKSALVTAREGKYSAVDLNDYETAYHSAGGQFQFKNYYETSGDKIVFRDFLKEHIRFTEHNLTSQQPPGHFHLVLCRNVLIYFNQSLRNRACKMLRESLHNLGYLAIGSEERLDFSGQLNEFSEIDSKGRIFRKVSLIPNSCKIDNEIMRSSD